MSPTPTLPHWFSQALAAFADGDIDTYMTVYASDAVHEFPFAAAGQVQRLEGQAAIAAYMRQLPQLIRFGKINIIAAREAENELIVEASARHYRLPDEAPFDLGYVWFITYDGEKVSRMRDYMSPLVTG